VPIVHTSSSGDAAGQRISRVAGWRILLWLGIVVAAAALLAQAIVFGEGFGALFWALGIPVVFAGVFAWRATAGDRNAKIVLIVLGAALTVVGTLVAILALGFSIGQSPVIELVSWPLPALGGLAILLGSLLSLREA
jgi:hypothetical protein